MNTPRNKAGRFVLAHLRPNDPTSHVTEQHTLRMLGSAYMCDCGMMLRGRTRPEAQSYLRIHHAAIIELIEHRQMGGSIEYDGERHGR